MSRLVVGARGDGQVWTKAHRARHEPRLKELVSVGAVEEIAGWLAWADPPRSGRVTPTRRVVGAIAWHLRVGGAWRRLPTRFPPWRTVYGWFRRWLGLGLFEVLLREMAHRRRRKAGRRRGPSLGVIDTQVVTCIAVRGPRGYDAAKGAVGRKRVALVDAEGPVQEGHLSAGTVEFFHQQRLVGVAAGKPVRGVDIEPLDGPGRYRVAQPLQRRVRFSAMLPSWGDGVR